MIYPWKLKHMINNNNNHHQSSSSSKGQTIRSKHGRWENMEPPKLREVFFNLVCSNYYIYIIIVCTQVIILCAQDNHLCWQDANLRSYEHKLKIWMHKIINCVQNIIKMPYFAPTRKTDNNLDAQDNDLCTQSHILCTIFYAHDFIYCEFGHFLFKTIQLTLISQMSVSEGSLLGTELPHVVMLTKILLLSICGSWQLTFQ